MTTSTTNPQTVLGILTDLRTALGLDAVVTGLNGVAYLAAGSLLDDAFGIPTGVLRLLGAFLVAYAVAVWAIRAPVPVSRPMAYGVVAANVAWALVSVGAVVGEWHSPSLVGTLWTIAQAVVVAGFAELQLTGLRRR